MIKKWKKTKNVVVFKGAIFQMMELQHFLEVLKF